MEQLTIGVDLGGTNVRAALVDKDGTILKEIEEPTQAHKGPDAVVAKIVRMIEKIGPDKADAIGIGSPGPLDPYRALILSPPNLPGWNRIPLADLITEKVGLPVTLDNDANAAALAEALHGAGKGYRHVFYITVSTGIGGGIVIDGEILQGASGYAGEVGNMIVDPTRNEKWGGLNAGSLEALASGTAIGKAGAKLLGLANGAAGVFQMAGTGNKTAEAIIDRALGYLAIGIANLAHTVNPDIFILGGGVMKSERQTLQPLRNKVAPLLYENLRGQLKIESAKLGSKCGVIGASLLPRVKS